MTGLLHRDPVWDPGALPTDASGSYDVVVVGGRVAGAATALHLARAGHRVLIVDRAGPPADTVSTHAIMRTGILQLGKSGLLERLIEAGTPAIRQVDLVFGDERVSFPVQSKYGVDAYYAPRRTRLDTVLLEGAMAAGAEFRTGVSVKDVERDRTGRAVGVLVGTRGGDEQRIGAKWVVGADGSRSRVARSVDAAVTAYREPTNAVVYGYFAGIDTGGYEFRFVDHRNVGLVPTDDGDTLAFVGGPLREAERDSHTYLFDTLRRVAPDIAARLAAAERRGRLHRANGVPSFLRDSAGPGWVLVGDAGFTEDPISAHGISDALRDAEIGADSIDIALRDPEGEAEALAIYRETRDHFARPRFDHSVALAGFDWDAGEASHLLRLLGDIGDAECRFLSQRRILTPA